jgi:glycosyltransferase involved in cell wall biosynthesis
VRVLLFHPYPHQTAGGERVTHALCQDLLARGHDAQVVTVDDGPFVALLEADDLPVQVLRAPGPWRRYGKALERPAVAAAGVASLPGYWLRLARLARRADVVHCNDHRGAVLAAPAAAVARVPLVWHLHGTYPSRPVTVLGARLADRILVVSEDTRERQPWIGPYAAKTQVLHNGLLTVAPEQEGSARPAVPPVVLCGARTHPDKGLETLIGAAGRLPDVRFEVAGPIQAGYEDYAAGLRARAGDNVAFLGTVPDPIATWSAAAVYAQPSRVEPFGMGVLEAMALGVPVVTTRVGGMREIVEDGVSGLQVEPEDDEALADAIGRVLADADLRARLIAGGRARVAARFGRAAMIDRLERVYTDVTAAGRTRTAACGRPL